MRKFVLLTGFEPFAGDTVNPSMEATRCLQGKTFELNGDEVVLQAVAIPTEFHRSIEILQQAIEDIHPEIVICVGQAGGRMHMTPEKIAINLDDARIPDNAGQQPIDRPIVENGPAAYWSSLPVKAMVQAMRDAGIPSSVSYSAGTYVCNHLFYGLMHLLAIQYPHIRGGGFVHIPFLPEQTVQRSEPSMSLEMIVQGLEICARTAMAEKKDIFLVTGTEQ